jgi:hypothetical protein
MVEKLVVSNRAENAVYRWQITLCVYRPGIVVKALINASRRGLQRLWAGLDFEYLLEKWAWPLN